MKVTLGGDRIGSGNKMKLHLHNYNRSSHNLSERWTSSMAPGVLYPFLVKPALRGDSWQINLEAACRTIPTQGPLFGSFKMQMDVFFCPMRLYQGILHNNPIQLGLNMKDVYFPVIELKTKANKDFEAGKMANDCLIKYLGLSGTGVSASRNTETDGQTSRYINAVPILAYYDIFKNYFSNKQEENAYIISEKTKQSKIIKVRVKVSIQKEWLNLNTQETEGETFYFDSVVSPSKHTYEIYINNENVNIDNTEFYFNMEDEEGGGTNYRGNIQKIMSDMAISNVIEYDYKYETDRNKITISFTPKIDFTLNISENIEITEEIGLNSFKLKNIDNIRKTILSYHELGSPLVINETENEGQNLPLNVLTKTSAKYNNPNQNPMNGLVVKTYQSDIYNNWINTEWIDGENGIAAITAIATTEGSIKIDEINIAEKLYNMLNRVAASGATYEDWQDVVYEEVKRRSIESPVYIGGMSNEIVFEEIIQTAPADGDPLGTLGGRGVAIKRKGGNIDYKCEEAGFIIGIISLTPRINYTQGNEFYLTDLKTMDDLHKPALDGIGYQNLIGERMAWFDTKLTPNQRSGDHVLTRSTIGKLPAWIEYMTSVDKAYGDFIGDKSFMILDRKYTPTETGSNIQDATTYIDPEKYNYAFAYKELNAQNFWVQIQSNIIARRLMSAKQIPNI